MKRLLLWILLFLALLTGCATNGNWGSEGNSGGYYGGNDCQAMVANPWSAGSLPPTCYGTGRAWR